jgi:hypothetical protein
VPYKFQAALHSILDSVLESLALAPLIQGGTTIHKIIDSCANGYTDSLSENYKLGYYSGYNDGVKEGEGNFDLNTGKGSYQDDGNHGAYSVGYKQGFNEGYDEAVLPSPVSIGDPPDADSTVKPGPPPVAKSTVIPGPPPPAEVLCCNSCKDSSLCDVTFGG